MWDGLQWVRGPRRRRFLDPYDLAVTAQTRDACFSCSEAVQVSQRTCVQILWKSIFSAITVEVPDRMQLTASVLEGISARLQALHKGKRQKSSSNPGAETGTPKMY